MESVIILNRPLPPPARVELETIAGSLWFNDMDELSSYRAEPLWRKIFGMTAYDKRLKRQRS